MKHLTHKFRKAYGQGADTQDLFIYLGDNSKNRTTWSAKSGRIPTFRVGNGKYWNVYKRRWLTGREKLAALSFPTCQAVAHTMGVPALPVRCTKRASHCAGNAMMFGNVAIMQLVAMSCFRLLD